MEGLNQEMGQFINEGIYKDNNSPSLKYIFDWDKDNIKTDYVLLNSNNLRSYSIAGVPYYFGYKFNNYVDKRELNIFKVDIKSNLGNADVFDQENAWDFIQAPLQKLSKEIDLTNFKVLCYPTRAEGLNPFGILNTTIRAIKDYLENPTLITIELIKNLVKNVKFDYEGFRKKYGNQYDEDIEKYMSWFKNSTMEFQMKRVVPGRLRGYFNNFLKFKTEEQKKLYQELQGVNVIIVDDIKTTNSTIMEVFRVLRSINESNNLYVYTLFGE